MTNNTTEYANNQFIFIDLNSNNIYTENDIPNHIKEIYPHYNIEKFKLNITYGILDQNINVNDKIINKFMRQNIIYIPNNDINRASFFGDPLPNILKYIIIYNENNNPISLHHENNAIYINTDTYEIINCNIHTNDKINIPDYIKKIFPENFL